MRLRVVCGFDVTMATFCPTKRFSSVDFPAFGRPTMATNPARFFFSSPAVSDSLSTILLSFADWLLTRQRSIARRRSRRGQMPRAQPQHFTLVRLYHFKAEPLQIDYIPRRGHFSGNVAQQPRNRRYRLVGLITEVHAQQLLHMRNAHTAAQYQAAIRRSHRIR